MRLFLVLAHGVKLPKRQSQQAHHHRPRRWITKFHLIVTTSYNTAKLWSRRGDLLATMPHQGYVYSSIFSPDGNQILTASADNTAKIWNRQGNLLATLQHELYLNSAAFSPDSRQIVSTSRDNTAKVWDRQGNLLATFQHQSSVNSAVFSPDGGRILTASWDNVAKIWYTAQGAIQWLNENDNKAPRLSEEIKKKYQVEN